VGFYLAVDVGGTKTTFVLADKHAELGRITTGTIKRMRTDAESAEQNLLEGLSALATETGVRMEAITRTCIGTAGNTVPLVTDWLREQFGRRVGGELVLVGDVEIALDAAFFGAPGVLLMAGTGSNVAGRLPNGSLTTAGGYGPVLADQGSGHRIGLQALRALFLAVDEGKETLLAAPILAAWQLHEVVELVAAGNRIPPPDFSKLSRIVVDCAEQGDAVAKEVLHREAEDLAYIGKLVIDRLRAADGRVEWVPDVAFTGSILEHVVPMREGVLAALRRDFPTIKDLPGVMDPVMGALWRARLESSLQ